MTKRPRRRHDRPAALVGMVVVTALTAFGCATSGATVPASSPPSAPVAQAPAPVPPAAPAAAASSNGADTRTVWDGVFTTRQARRGGRLFNAQCGSCHEPGEFVGGFSTALDLFTVRFIMPEPAPDSLEPQEFADIIAYIYSEAGMPAGDTELPGDDAVLEKVLVTPRPGSR